MIEIMQSYGSSDGQVFKTLAEAQAREIGLLLKLELDDVASTSLADQIVANAEKICDILNTKPNSDCAIYFSGTGSRTPKVIPITDADLRHVPEDKESLRRSLEEPK